MKMKINLQLKVKGRKQLKRLSMHALQGTNPNSTQGMKEWKVVVVTLSCPGESIELTIDNQPALGPHLCKSEPPNESEASRLFEAQSFKPEP